MHAKLLTLCMALCAVCLTATSQNVPDYVPTDGLVGWWPLNGDVLDIGPTGMNGVNYGAQCDENRNQSPCEAMSFTAGDYLSIAADSSFTSQEGTITGWVKLNSYASQSGASGYNHFFNRWAVSSHEFVFAANIDGLYMYVENELFQSDTLPTLNEWHHLAFSYSSINGMAKIYIDGQNVAEFEGVDTLTPTNHPLHIGGNPLVPAYNSVDGSMDDVGFWERTLELSEITAIYNAQLPVLGCTDSIACNFDEEANEDNGSCIPSGCMEPEACNYNALAECEGEACDYACCPGPGCCSAGMFWDYELEHCMNYETCQEDLDGDGVIGVNDLMQLLSLFGTACEAEDVDPELGEFTCGDPMNYHGYDYATVQIGEQCWFAENLRTGQYSNGDEVPHHPQGSSWLDAANAESGAWTHFSNDSAFGVTYGKLYNWYVTVDERGICPSGWHAPENAEWSTLVNHYGGSASAAIELKGNHSEVWFGNGTDGFNALPGGSRDWGNAVFFSQGTSGDWWTSSHQGAGFWRGMDADLDNVHNALYGRAMGNSVRCLKNTE